MAELTHSSDGMASLYRRYRPGRFSELRGQDHIVRALQGAVANDRVVHAYLFSGPRGTGKTTTARILAKALNCEKPVNGDACNYCASCVSITRGTSLDVMELDAASNNGVEDIRDITAGAWHGTPGRWKVYIIDEVHMLSKAAEAAFLKTLEEPPSHVVFVLATTEPHRVVSTIRSRTQHLEFRLFDSVTLLGLLEEVRDAAELTIDDAALATAVRLGRGSARDALSALDQVVATGSLADATPPFDSLLEAMSQQNAVTTLSSLAELARMGWDPEQLAESLASELRQIFLLLVAPDIADALGDERARLTAWGQAFGLPRTVRALETLGRTLREMKSSPVPSIMLEVALARLTRPELDDSVEALDERLTRLERAVAQGVASPAPAAPAPAARPISSLTRTTPRAATPAVTPDIAPAESPSTTASEAVTSNSSEETGGESSPAPTPGGELTLAEFVDRFTTRVLPRLSRTAQIFLGSSTVRSLHGSTVVFTVPSESMHASAEKIQSGLRSALEHEFKTTLQISWLVDSSTEGKLSPTVASSTTIPPADSPVPDDDMMDDRDIADSEELEATSVMSMLITDAFPGAEEIV